MSSPNDPTTRFSDRVEDYRRYRPSYPDAALELLEKRCGLAPTCVVADVGSGTGILSRLLLGRSRHVHSIEPNDAMRACGEEQLAAFQHSTSHNATAEQTGLPDQSVHLITAAQAFHWFDQERCGQEWRRILKPHGHVALLWNDRRTAATPFLKAYEKHLLAHSIDYGKVHHRRITEEALARFFRPGHCNTASFVNEQVFDFAGLRGRHLSSSYVPKEEHPGFEAMLADLKRIFGQHERDGLVRFEYETQVHFGRLTAE